MAELSRYKRGDYDRDTGSYAVDYTPAVGHPPIPDALDVIAGAVHAPWPPRPAPAPIRWHHRGHAAWDAVEVLHRADRHDDAASLARLLRWTETEFDHGQVDGWELAAARPVRHTPTPTSGEEPTDA